MLWQRQPSVSKERVRGSWGCLEASRPPLAPEYLERVHRHQVSLAGGAQLKLITSQAIKQSSADNHFGYGGCDCFTQESRAETSVVNNQSSEPANSLLLTLPTHAQTHAHVFSLFSLCLPPWAEAAVLRQGRVSTLYSLLLSWHAGRPTSRY